MRDSGCQMLMVDMEAWFSTMTDTKDYPLSGPQALVAVQAGKTVEASTPCRSTFKMRQDGQLLFRSLDIPEWGVSFSLDSFRMTHYTFREV